MRKIDYVLFASGFLKGSKRVVCGVCIFKMLEVISSCVLVFTVVG